MPTFSITDSRGRTVQIVAPRQPTESELQYIYAHPQHALPQSLTAPVRLNLDPNAQEAAVEPLETAPGTLLAPRRVAPPQPVGPMQLLTGVTSAPAAAAMGSLADDPGDALKAIHEALNTAWRAPITPTEEQPTMGGELEKRGVPMNPLLKGAVDLWADPANLIGGGPEDVAKAGIVGGTAGAKGLGRLYSRLTEEVLPRFKAKAAHPSRVMSDIKNFGSPMEAEWTGVLDWLRGKGNTPVTREEFEQFAKSNPLKLEETKLGFDKPEDAHALPQVVVDTGYGNQWAIQHPWAQSGTGLTAHVAYFDPGEAARLFGRKASPAAKEKPWVATFQNKEEFFKSKDEAIDWAKKAQMDLLADPKSNIWRTVNKPRWGRSDLSLPGGKDYREIVMRLPFTKEQEAAIRANGYSPTDQEAARLGGGFSHGAHWPGMANPLTHLRLNDRVTAEGKQALHIEELQSDWHQQGREKGYKDSTALDAATGKLEEAKTGYKSAVAEAVAALESAGYKQYSRYTPEHLDNPLRHTVETGAKEGLPPEIVDRIKSARENLKTAYERLGIASADWNAASGKLSVAVPDAPYKGTAWAELGLKRALIEAVEGGKDELTWTTGRQQSQRYDNLLEDVTAVRHGADGWQVKNGSEWMDAGEGELEEVRRLLKPEDSERFSKWKTDREATMKSDAAVQGQDRYLQYEDALHQKDELLNSQTRIYASIRDSLLTSHGMTAQSIPSQPLDVLSLAEGKATAARDTSLARRVNEYRSSVAASDEMGKRIAALSKAPRVKNAAFTFSSPLEIGSRGMQQQYDEVLPNIANKIGKPHGAQVKKTKALTRGNNMKIQKYGDWWQVVNAENNHEIAIVPTRAEAEAAMANAGEEVWSLPITDALRKHVLEKGLPLAAVVPLALPPTQKVKGETTHLAPRDEARFQAWVKANKIPDVDHQDSHYDYRGYWKKYGDKPVKFGKDHFTDEFKQHGHPTFSAESKYSRGKQDGGQWVGDTLVPAPVASHKKN